VKLVKDWSNTGQTLGVPRVRTPAQHSPNTCQALVKHWSNTGQTLVKHWSSTGQALVKHWSSTGQALVKHWSNTGQTLVKHWSKTGPFLVHRSLAPHPHPPIEGLFDQPIHPPPSARAFQREAGGLGPDPDEVDREAARLFRLVVKYWSNTGQTLVKPANKLMGGCSAETAIVRPSFGRHLTSILPAFDQYLTFISPFRLPGARQRLAGI
jgi:hypothetical protein